MDAAKKIAEAVLYEGYLLWPYRRSARKNQQRWTFGGVYPREYSVARGEDDPWIMQTQCLVSGGDESSIEVRVRFLHVVERKVGKKVGEALQYVDELRVGGELYLSWDEAAERELAVGRFKLSELAGSPKRVEIEIPGGSREESLTEPAGESVGTLVRSWRTLHGATEVEAEPSQGGVFKVTVRITNTTPWGGEDRESTLRQTFVSTHTTLEVQAGEFVSLIDPPEELREAAEGCENLKTWPVLVGEEEDRSTLLSSPIILYDYPQIAPESPGDLFDGTEIDQMLILNVLNLTDEEKEEMRASDPRGREILERCESLSPEELMKLNGTFRDIRMLRG
jgi:hypothetical protein